MKKITALIIILIGLSGNSSAQCDSLQANRYVTRSTTYGVGYTNILDTYLSPQEYTGIEGRVARETIRMTKLFDGHISLQNFFQANLSYTHNHTEDNNTFAGLVNWNYGLHYQFRINENLKLLAGGLSDMNGGFVYNLRNSNNPASAKVYVNIAASGMAIYRFKIKNYQMVARYQANVPVAGVMFSPNYGQSYYEIFTLGNSDGVIKFTTLKSQPSVRQIFSLDLPICYSKLRLSYLWDIQQSKVNQLKTHTYSHIFMVGFVRDLYLMKSKRGNPLPENVRAY
ncbi:DUF3316 domain-containing protein [uncultured Bacteroides sp.]|uniref:DUF3316 domain-containing protein n=1 Tax=uncultured Bacteroides sp. TaxID=162156 RepID=UPI002AAAA884|nr:DUF3316 domain-containing protein [uncultured Bacteroides sp.]